MPRTFAIAPDQGDAVAEFGHEQAVGARDASIGRVVEPADAAKHRIGPGAILGAQGRGNGGGERGCRTFEPVALESSVCLKSLTEKKETAPTIVARTTAAMSSDTRRPIDREGRRKALDGKLNPWFCSCDKSWA